MKNYRYSILGYYGFGNLGDELLLKACIEILESREIPREKILAFSNNPKETSETFNIKSVNRWNYIEVIKALRESENLLLGGGGLFQDSTSIKSCLWYWFFVRLAKISGVKVFAIGQSIGSLNHKISKILTSNALKACEKINVRDKKSLILAEELGCKNVEAGYDLVLTLKPSKTPDKLKSSILVNLRPCKILENSVEIISPYVKDFDGEKIGTALSSEDEETLNKFREKLTLTKIIRVKNFNDAENLWNSALCAVGMRLHFGVLSAIFETPVSLIPYDEKVTGFAENFKIPCIIDEWKAPLMPRKISDVIKFEL